MKPLLFLIYLFIASPVPAQTKPFRFVFISDTHIGSPNGGAEEDLRRTVADVNSLNSIAFVVITGDITELGKNSELQLAKQILDSLKIPYYIIPGNHDTGWSESGGLGFTNTFGNDKFLFKYNGINFIGCASGPYVRMSDGHVPRGALIWMEEKLKKIKSSEPVIFLNHYPLDNGLDNWYEVISMLKKKNIILALCGHGHNNRIVQAEDIPAIMGRSNLRAKASEGGYNLVDVRMDSIIFIERKPLSKTEKQWTAVKNEMQHYDEAKSYPRPDFSVNEKYKKIKRVWTYQSRANVISTPAIVSGTFADGALVVFGNQDGQLEAIDKNLGISRWIFQTGGPIFSSPAISNSRNHIIFGSSDSYIYTLDISGKLVWKVKTAAPVLGSPIVYFGIIYIGGSDSLRAIREDDGQRIFAIKVDGPVTSRPVVTDSTLVFGAWDKYLYCVDINKKELRWKWSNGSPVINYSPAACIPVIKDNVVYIVAPDRYLTAIDLNTGLTLWRTNQSAVRESIGISSDGKMVYGKTMQDTVVAYYTNKEQASIAWKLNAGYGYEHSPSMLIEKNGKLFFGTRNGAVYCIDTSTHQVRWVHKIDNSMVNTVNVLTPQSILVSTMDGKVCLLKEEQD